GPRGTGRGEAQMGGPGRGGGRKKRGRPAVALGAPVVGPSLNQPDAQSGLNKASRHNRAGRSAASNEYVAGARSFHRSAAHRPKLSCSPNRLGTKGWRWKDRAMEGASRTAILTAQFRAAHALVDADPIFEDRFALAFAGCSAADVIGFLAANAPDSCAHVVRLFVSQRSRFMEGAVERAVGGGVDQYVDLGAG